MQALSQTTKIFTPKPFKTIQHISLHSTFTKTSQNPFPRVLSQASSSSSAFSESMEELRKSSQNPQERDDSFQGKNKESTMDQELIALEAEIEEMLSL